MTRAVPWSRLLSGDLRVRDLLQRKGRPLGVARSPTPQPSTVAISNEESDFYTIVDVVADDRLGLLHDLTRTIARHGFEIYIAKAGTVLDQVTDTFYLKDREGKKILDPDAIERLRIELLRAAEVREGDGAG